MNNIKSSPSGKVALRSLSGTMSEGAPDLPANTSAFYTLQVPGLGTPEGAVVSCKRGETIATLQVFAKPDVANALSLHITNTSDGVVELAGYEFAVFAFGY